LKSLSAWLKAFWVFVLFRLLRATWRLEEDLLSPPIQDRLRQRQPVVFAHFHEDEWAMLAFYMHRRMSVLVSLSDDGKAMAKFLGWLGFDVIRGSSSRGAVAGFLQLIRNVRENGAERVSLAVDGPRGPRRRAKKGVLKLAQSLKSPIVMGAAVASRPLIFKKSWSKAFIPLPFSRVRLVYAEPMSVEEICRGVERDDYATLLFELEERMKKAKESAKKALLREQN
jgi:lysophospholipid acyltransferase (LPLAT)-like uncharacterized protein